MKSTLLALLLLVSSSTANAQDGAPMRFKLMSDCLGGKCEPVGFGVGQISQGSAEVLQAFLDRHQVKRIFMHSPGGNLGAGLKMGMLLRERGVDVALNDKMMCFSACAYAFLGGNRRQVRQGGLFGLHRFRAANGSINEDEAQEMLSGLGRYVSSMGLDSRLVELASRAPSSEMITIGRNDAQKLRIDNTGVVAYGWTLTPSKGELIAMSQGMADGSDYEVSVIAGLRGDSVVVLMATEAPDITSRSLPGAGQSTLSFCVGGQCLNADALGSSITEDANTNISKFVFGAFEFTGLLEEAEVDIASVFTLRRSGKSFRLVSSSEDLATVIQRTRNEEVIREDPVQAPRYEGPGVVTF